MVSKPKLHAKYSSKGSIQASSEGCTRVPIKGSKKAEGFRVFRVWCLVGLRVNRASKAPGLESIT